MGYLDQKTMRRTKIVATIGPASSTEAVLERLISAGATVFRLNFSHGSHEDHSRSVTLIRSIAKRRGEAVAILQDLSGPKIRTTKVALPEGIVLETGRTLVITNDETVVGTPERIGTTYEPLPRDAKAGDTILLDDGNMELRVLGTTARGVNCEIIHGGVLKSNKGMNLPGVSLSIPALTEKDRTDLAFGLSLGVDFVALSFVRRAEDLRETKELIRSLGGDTPLIAKIEKREAIDNLASILEEADGVMVARGDLGVELSTEEVPTLQKRIIALANAAGKPVITATQMLESMIENPVPTRAEVTDIFNAVVEQVDCVMLSGETSVGKYPDKCVEVLDRVISRIEKSYPSDRFASDAPLKTNKHKTVKAAIVLANSIPGAKLMVFTLRGVMAHLLAHQRPEFAPIFAFTPKLHVSRTLLMAHGVHPFVMDFAPGNPEGTIHAALEILHTHGLVQKGNPVVILSDALYDEMNVDAILLREA